jgi:succinoglycan biosynthesis transport protein ExoP
MSSHNAVPEPARPADPTLVPVPAAPPGADFAVEAGWHGGALAPPPALASGPNAASLLKGLQRRWWVALFLGVLLAGSAGVGAWYGLEPKWTAEAPVHIDPVPQWLLSPVFAASPDRNEFINYERWQAAQMKSRFVLNAARKREDVKNLPIIREQPDPIQFLDDEIKIDYKDGDEVLNIQIMGSDPEAAKAIVNAVREEYFNEVIKKEHEARENRKREVDAVVSQTETKLDEKEKTLHGLAEQLGITDSGQLPPQVMEMRLFLNEKRQRLSAVQDERIKLQARLETYEGQAKGITVTAPSEQTVEQALDSDPKGHLLLEQKERLAALVNDYKHTVVDPNWPGLVSSRQKLQMVAKKLEERRAELRNALGKGLQDQARTEYEAGARQLRTELAALEKQERELQAEVKAMASDQTKLGGSSVEFVQRQDEVNDLKEHLKRYKDEQAKLEIELRPNVPQRVTKFEDPMLLKRDQKKQIAAAVLGPVAMLALVCFGVGWWECRARRIHTADEVATGLGVRVVGAVPPLPNAARLVAGGETREDIHVHSLLESIDSIRTVLLRDAHAAETRVIMVTSAVGGEGKTTLAAHLAGSLARAGRRTLLIDCDLRRPSAHQLFELPLQPGFSEAILGEVHIAEATLSTPVDGLWMIPAGQWDREVLQALAREGLDKVFEKLKNEYDFVIVDSHPVLPATDSLLIGQHVDAVILSVLRGVSQAPKVYGASQRLATLGIRIFGAVVNGLPEDDVYTGAYQYAAPAPAAR